MSDRNKIAQSLSVEQLDAFVTELAALPGRERTLEAIKHRAAQMGITIGLMSAKAFRDTTFERHLDRLRSAQEIATQVENIEAGGNTLADASAKLLSKRIFEKLIAADDEDSIEEVDLDEMTLAVSRLRQGNVQQKALEAKLRESEAKLRASEAREKEREEKAKAADRALEKLRDPDTDLSQSEREAIVRTVDEVLGIKVSKKS